MMVQSMKGQTVADHTVRIIAKEVGNDEVMVKVTNWKTEAKVGQTVRFRSLQASNLDVTLRFPSKRDSPFTVITIKVAKKTTTPDHTIKAHASGTYKYSIEAKLSNGDKFVADPRFIIT